MTAYDDDELGCVYGTYDLGEQRAMLERFESSSQTVHDDDHRHAERSDVEPLYRQGSAGSFSCAAAAAPQGEDDLNVSCLLEDLDEDLVREQERILAEIQRSTSSVSKLTVSETKLMSSSISTASTGTMSTSTSSWRSLDSDWSSEGGSSGGSVSFDLTAVAPIVSRTHYSHQQTPPVSPRSESAAPRSTPPRTLATAASSRPIRAKSRRRLDILESMSKQESESGLLRYYDRRSANNSAPAVSMPERPEAQQRVESSAARLTSAPGATHMTKLRTTKSAPVDKVTVRCAGECGRKYFVSTKCKVLLCPRCDTLTPMSLGLVE